MLNIEELFDSFRKEAFRFEALPAYRISETEELSVFESFTNGELNSRPADAGWLKCLKQWKGDGKKIQRIRMIPAKYTPYVDFELSWAYPFNLDAGEEILVIPEAEVRKLASEIPPDFWLFDSKYVAVFEYSPQGEWLGANILESGIDSYLQLASKLRGSATDFTAYLKTKRQAGMFP
jgi:hypothetical protein